MKLRAVLPVVTLVTALPAAAGPREDIEALNARWTQAVLTSDIAVLETILAPELELTGGGDRAIESVSRGAWLANLRRMQIASYSTRITDLQVQGGFAVATVRGSWEVTFAGQTRRDAFELRDV